VTVLVIRDRASAETKRLRRSIERIGPALAPMPELVGRHRFTRLLLGQAPQRIGRHVDLISPHDIGPVFSDLHPREQLLRLAQRRVDLKSFDHPRHVNDALIAGIPPDAQGYRPGGGRYRRDAWQNLPRHPSFSRSTRPISGRGPRDWPAPRLTPRQSGRAAPRL